MSDYEREYEWGGYDVTKTRAGWVVSSWSRVQGNLTNFRHLVKPTAELPHDIDLYSDWNEHTEVGEYIARRATETPDKVLAKGWLVE